MTDLELKDIMKEYDPRLNLEDDKKIELEDPNGLMICPEYWCMYDKIPLEKSQLVEIKGSLCCPKCSNVMKKRMDKQFYNIHKTCFDCVVDMEHELKKNGKWEAYENKIHNDEIDNKIKEYKLWVEEKVNESNTGFVTEAGDVEQWKGKVNKELVAESVDEVITYLEGLKK